MTILYPSRGKRRHRKVCSWKIVSVFCIDKVVVHKLFMTDTAFVQALITLPSSSLCIGDWRRIKPLICLFSRRNQSFTWYLSSESVGFKLECPLTCVTKINFSGPRDPSPHEFSEGIRETLGQLTLELTRPPQFYMEVFRSSTKAPEMANGSHKASWRQCTDFTEGHQATSTLRHIISGPFYQLRHAITQLYQTSESISRLVELQEQSFPTLDQHSEHCELLPEYPQDSNAYYTSAISLEGQQEVPLSSWSAEFPFDQLSQSQLESFAYALPTPTSAVMQSSLSQDSYSVSTNSTLDLTGLQLETPGLCVTSFEQQQQQQ